MLIGWLVIGGALFQFCAASKICVVSVLLLFDVLHAV
jgi:hypothetical protein